MAASPPPIGLLNRLGATEPLLCTTSRLRSSLAITAAMGPLGERFSTERLSLPPARTSGTGSGQASISGKPIRCGDWSSRESKKAAANSASRLSSAQFSISDFAST